MTRLYVHKYLGCLCVENIEIHNNFWGCEYSVFDKDILESMKQHIDEAPECWELIDCWED